MKAKLILPKGNYTGNLLWRKTELLGKEKMLEISLTTIRDKKYWASSFPEGDGVTFDYKDSNLSSEQVFADFQAAFPWLSICIGSLGSSNLELAELEEDAQTPMVLTCKAIVPVLKLHFESSFDLGPFCFICASDFDSKPHERLGDWKGSYLQFDIKLEYV